jgi:Protein of unknown function with PCYCGC motif
MRGRARAMTFGLGAVVVVALVAGVAWWAQSDADPVTTDAIGDRVQTRRGGALPVFADSPDKAALYRFARERNDVLQWMPCTCGCAQLGHASNRFCYVKAETADTTTWTSHAAT